MKISRNCELFCTLAWFAAQQQASVTELTNTTSGYIGVEDHAAVDSLKMRIKVNWPASFANIDLTAGAAKAARSDTEDVAQVIGGAYVIDANGDVKKNTSDALVKSGTVSITLATAVGDDHGIQTKIGNAGTEADWRDATADEIALLASKTLTVKVKATGQLRIGTSLLNSSAGDGEGAVGAYDPSAADPTIGLGTVTISSVASGTITYTYSPILDINGESTNTSLNFYYSVSPKDDDGTGDYAYDDESASDANKQYGTFVVTLVTD